MNYDFMYSNPYDFAMQAPPMGSGCTCQGGACQSNIEGQFTQDMSQYNPPFPSFQGMPMSNPGTSFDYQNSERKDNEERIIPLFIGGLLGASIASRPFYGYPAYYPYYYPPYQYGYYNYGFARPRRYPYYYR